MKWRTSADVRGSRYSARRPLTRRRVFAQKHAIKHCGGNSRRRKRRKNDGHSAKRAGFWRSNFGEAGPKRVRCRRKRRRLRYRILRLPRACRNSQRNRMRKRNRTRERNLQRERNSRVQPNNQRQLPVRKRKKNRVRSRNSLSRKQSCI